LGQCCWCGQCAYWVLTVLHRSADHKQTANSLLRHVSPHNGHILTTLSTSLSIRLVQGYYVAPVRVRSIVISLSVCLSVCLSACISHKPDVQIAPNFLCMLHVAVTRSSSDGNAIGLCYVLSVLWMMSCFHIMVGIAGIKGDSYVSSNTPGGGTGGEVCCVLSSCSQSSAIYGYDNH